ncbi:NADPH2:quinone reductase [Rhizobium sp. BK529]|uniref:quinone oxidoreductase family protein n=1 Tax=unclassified Rhizobium TaxID=2613769 RepID=UPI001043A0DD|nr:MULTISPECIES: zinc-binding dehydrogenase [unclassified Rhizobium]MBB3590036.1 NADPH2:quinone reductase [Rhizobium sp. BK529]TCS04732.1 NADPH2:quinone reductase [Rhizobium sp. BK418]
MKAIQFSRFGPPEVLKLVEVPTPEPKEREVLVRVHAAGVNFFEVLMRGGRYAMTPSLPMFPGVEAAGVVEVSGPGADTSLVGGRVAVPLFAIRHGYGGYAEYVVVDSDSLVRLPDSVSFADATALMVQGLTALHMVRRSPPKGKAVIVNAAGGGVGSLLVQLARSEGASMVIAGAGSEAKRKLALSLGADLAVDYTREGWVASVKAATAGQGADVIYETVGGDLAKASLAALAPAGEMLLAAMGRFSFDLAEIRSMLDLNQSLKGFSLLPLIADDWRRDLAALFELVVSRALSVVQGGSFPLHEAAEAHRALEERRVSGKVVLVP